MLICLGLFKFLFVRYSTLSVVCLNPDLYSAIWSLQIKFYSAVRFWVSLFVFLIILCPPHPLVSLCSSSCPRTHCVEWVISKMTFESLFSFLLWASGNPVLVVGTDSSSFVPTEPVYWLLFIFETGSHFLAQTGLKFIAVFLPHLPGCCCYRHEQALWACFVCSYQNTAYRKQRLNLRAYQQKLPEVHRIFNL